MTSGPATPTLSAETRERVIRARDRYPSPRSAILPALWAVQEQLGWLAPEGMAEVAGILGLRPSEVQAVSTFYSMYFQKPAGRHHVLVCINAPCALRGADEIVEHVGRSLGVPNKGTTADGAFTWESTIECLGACGYAPMMQIDHMFHEHLTPEKVDRIFQEVRDQPVHHGPHGQGAPGAPAVAALVAARGGESGRTAERARRKPSVRDRDTGHSTPQASPGIAEEPPPPAEVPAPSVHAERAEALLAEAEVARKPAAPKVKGGGASLTEQLAPGAVEGRDAAPGDAAGAASQRAVRDPRRGRRRKS